MPGKSNQFKGKHPHHQSKKSKAKQRLSAMASQSTITAETSQQAAAISTPLPPKVSGPVTKAKTVQHPYIISELKRIGILAGAILVILIVLAVILS